MSVLKFYKTLKFQYRHKTNTFMPYKFHIYFVYKLINEYREEERKRITKEYREDLLNK